MSDSYLWLRAGHIIGFILWVGPLIALANLLAMHRRVSESTVTDLVPMERTVAMVMDIGAVITLACGVALILQTKILGEAWVMKQGWMHIKLTIVLVLLATHVYLRIKLGKAKRGDTSGLSGALRPVPLVLVIAIVILAAVRPF